MRTSKQLQKICRIQDTYSNVIGGSVYEQRTFDTIITNGIPFMIAPKRIKHLGINLTQEAQDLYTKNYNLLLKEIKKLKI